MTDIVEDLRKRAEIRRQIPGRKSVQSGEEDRLAAQLDAAADEIERLRKSEPNPIFLQRQADMIEWLRCLPTFFTDDPHRIYVHGGLMREGSYLPLDQQNKDVCQWLTSDKVTDDGPFEGRHVVHGHMQWADGPILLPNRTNLDTYAWRTGRLAIGVFDDDIPGGPIEILWAEGEPWQS